MHVSACFDHLWQRPGSDLPKLRADEGGMQWHTLPGISCPRDLRNESAPVLGTLCHRAPLPIVGFFVPPFPFGTPTRSSLGSIGLRAFRLPVS
jgi:hypothetical protein